MIEDVSEILMLYCLFFEAFSLLRVITTPHIHDNLEVMIRSSDWSATWAGAAHTVPPPPL